MGSLSNQVSYDAFNYVDVSNYENKTSFGKMQDEVVFVI